MKEKSKLTVARGKEILQKMTSNSVLVVGDMILDRYIWGSVDRISPEAPVPVVRFNCQTSVPGGAANVARNLSTLGVKSTVVGAIGADEEGEILKELLRNGEIDVDPLFKIKGYPTSAKTRIIASQQQLLRLDQEETLQLNDSELEKIKKRILRELDARIGAVIVADYAKGFVSQGLLDFLRDECKRRNIWLSLDPKPAHSLNIKGVSLITPNRKEAFELAGIPDEHKRTICPLEDDLIRRVIRRLREVCSADSILITLGEQGMLLCKDCENVIHIPTVAREVFDVSGAGDTVIAALTAAVTSGANLEEAAVLANHAAGVVVAKIGTATAAPEEILKTLSMEDKE